MEHELGAQPGEQGRDVAVAGDGDEVGDPNMPRDTDMDGRIDPNDDDVWSALSDLHGTTPFMFGPTPATRKVLARAGLRVEDIDLFELNEAFASVVLKWMRDLEIPAEKVNVNGGAIALGHPLGATGAMILGTLVDELERRQLRYGLATLCVGAGMGIATIIERV